MFNMCDFDSRKNSPKLILHWPVIPSQLYDVNINTDTTISVETEIILNNSRHNIHAQYEGSFYIKKAVIRAKFVGDENYHSFYIGEHDKLNASVLIGYNTDEAPISLMVDGRLTESALAEFTKPREPGEGFTTYHDIAELEEFYMFAVTGGQYYKKHMEPRAVNKDLVLFTCYNKARNLTCDTVASFKDGLCDPDTIFNGSDTEDVLAEWARNLPK